MKKKKIAVVDDHTLIAKAISSMVNSFESFEVIFEAANGKLLIEELNKNIIPDIILLDISMPEMDGFETAQWLNQNHPNILILVLSMQDDENSVIKMLRRGVQGYMKKNCTPNELEFALNSLVEDGSFFPNWIDGKIFRQAMKAETEIKFTEREREVMKYIVTDLSYKEIGEKMYVSGRTVESYRDSLFEKLNINSRVGLAVYAIKNGMAD